MPTPDGRLFEFFDGTATVLSQHCAIKSINDDLTAGGLSAEPESSFDLFVYPNDRRNKRFGTISRWYITVWYPVVFRRFTYTHEYYFNYTLLERCAITKADVSVYKVNQNWYRFLSTSPVFISKKYNGTRYCCARKHIVSGLSFLLLSPVNRKL